MPWYKVSDVSINGEAAEHTLTREAFIINDIPSDSVFEVVVRYGGQLNFRSDFSRMSKSLAVFREEELLPNGGEKMLQFVRMHFILPKGWEGIGIGSLVHRDSTADSTSVVWEFDGALPNIGWICAGRFQPTETLNGPVPVSVHLAEAESTSALNIATIAADVLRYYSEAFTPYRFGSLNIVQVDDWVAGPSVLAIAAPSFIMVKKLAFTTDDRFNKVESILPHEIAHQWWPGSVFIADEDAAFLSEGLCEYSALLYGEHSGTKTRRDSLATHPLLRLLLSRIQQGKDLPLQKKADLRALPTHYLKASYVYNMLRRMFGDGPFLRLLKEYARRYEAREAHLEEFQNLATEIGGRTTGWFFDQWVRNRGVPRMKIYNVKSVQKAGDWITRGRVRMVGYDKYTTLAPIGAEISSGLERTVVWLGADSAGIYRNDAPFEIVTREKPRRVLLDPDGDILRMRPLPATFADLREPADAIMIVGTADTTSHLLALAKKDSAIMDGSGWSIVIKPDTSITLGTLQHDRVILYGKAVENRVADDLHDQFPYSATDSIRVAGEAVFDSSLALMQIIENPYNAQGLMIWVAPLTAKANPVLLPYDHSWVIARGKEEISSGKWQMEDKDGIVEVK